MNKTILIISCFLLAFTVSAPAQNDSAQQEEVKKILDRQVEAWNLGDLEAFMETYWNSEELTYFSGGGPRNGWQATLERYIKTYQSPGSEMGFLTFNSVEVELMGPESAFVRGKWFLDREKMEDVGGLFTLILKKFPDGWKIIHDHSSS